MSDPAMTREELVPLFTAKATAAPLEANQILVRHLKCNFSAGKKLVLDVTPMIGGVFGRTNGIAPGCDASLTYKKIELSISNEYVFDTTHKSGNFYYLSLIHI